MGSCPLPRYCALLRLPSSFPVGSLLAPFRYLGLTRHFSCSSRLGPGWAHPPGASPVGCQGVDFAGHPLSGFGSQGDGRLSRVPGLPLCTHAPLSDPGGVPSARLDADRTTAFRTLNAVSFRTNYPVLSFCPPLYSFRSSVTRPVLSPYLCFAHCFSAVALRFGCRPGG